MEVNSEGAKDMHLSNEIVVTKDALKISCLCAINEIGEVW